jgi:hypothetical protein
MREDTEIRIPQDDERIDVTDLKEVDYWTQWFGVSEERLRTAVASAGTVRTTCASTSACPELPGNSGLGPFSPRRACRALR